MRSSLALVTLSSLVLVGCPGAPLPNAPLDAGGDVSLGDGGSVDAGLDAFDDEDVGPRRTRITGAVEKGPFVLGSSVVVSAIDEIGNPTGDVFFTSTRDDLGRFQLVVDWIGPISIEASGYYYNEATGELSTSFLTLRAFAEVRGEGDQAIFVNILTHLAYERARTLAEGGMDLRNAIALADREIRWGMGIGPERYEPGAVASGLQILGTDDAPSAYLLAVAATLTQAAVLRAEERGGSIDANLQEIVNRLQLDLAPDGELDEALRLEIDRAEEAVVADEVTEALLERIRLVGSTTIIPDIDRGLDSDNDGIANFDDNCPLIANPEQGPVVGVCSAGRVEGPAGLDGIGGGATGDFDGDGDSDVLFVTNSGHFQLGANDGTGTLSLGAVHGGGLGASCVASAHDVDDDGDLDVTCDAAIAHNDGTGHFDPATLLDVATPGSPLGENAAGQPMFIQSFATLTLADLDDDGSLDAFGEAWRRGGVPEASDLVLAAAWGGPTGFSPPFVLFDGFDPGTGTGPAVAADFDANGALDVVFSALAVSGGSASPGTLRVLYQTAPRAFRESTTPYDVAPGFVVDLRAGDFDDDGSADVAWLSRDVSSGTREALVVAHGSVSGELGRELRVELGASAAIAVLQTDGPDLVATLASAGPHGLGWSGELRVHGERAGALVPSRALGSASQPQLVAGDLDGSGGHDLAFFVAPPLAAPAGARVLLINPADPCRTATDGDSCGDGRICLYEACVGTRCGDRFVDAAAYEECDDGNTVSGDGCELGCVFTCTSDAGCGGADPCAGMATCDVGAHRCVPSGVPLSAGTPCSTGTVSSGVCTGGTTSACTPVGCGNGVVDAGEDCDDRRDGDDADGCTDLCTFSCDRDATCDDGDACTGVETCDLSSHRCVLGTPPSCSAPDACHAARCDAVTGCESVLRDGDGDGVASTALGPCGTDCDDLRADVYPGAEELCDGVDNDCEGGIDENAPLWYVDCDLDGYASGTSGMVRACVPPPAHPSCITDDPWTSRRPAPGSADCDDHDPVARPGGTEVVGNTTDEDCDGWVRCHVDADGDGYRLAGTTAGGTRDGDCTDPTEAYRSAPLDCDDTNRLVFPGARDSPGNLLDENCDGTVTCWLLEDEDGDGFTVLSGLFSANDLDCDDPHESLTTGTGDCSDQDPSRYPGAPETVGDRVDSDCDGGEMCYLDRDLDGYGSELVRSADVDCWDSIGSWHEAIAGGDCLDPHCTTAVCAGSQTHPMAEGEAIGGPDLDCSGTVRCVVDADRDGLRGRTFVESADTDCTDPGEALPSAASDCCDADPRARSGQLDAHVSASSCGSFDYDCDGTATPTITTRHTCTRVSGMAACRATSGWVSTVPACGATAAYLVAGPGGEGCQYVAGSCIPIAGYVSTAFAQRCR